MSDYFLVVIEFIKPASYQLVGRHKLQGEGIEVNKKNNQLDKEVFKIVSDSRRGI